MLNFGLEEMTRDLTNTDLFAQLFDDYPEGVMVLNVHTVLVYYNRAQGLIDDLTPEQSLGRTILELYRVGDNTMYPTLRCLFSRKPLINYPCYYVTHRGKLINSIHNVFPLFNQDKLLGCICFIHEYGEMSGQYNLASSAAPGERPGEKSGPARPTKHTFDQIITQDQAMRRSLEIASQAARTLSPIMLHGETGCGKEMFARAIHDTGDRRQKPFLALNCAAIPESLLEGLLFGTVKGAFTGAEDKPGMLEMADGGSIFLDEINSMPLGLQSKMLRAIQEQRIRRVGGAKEKAVSLKIISACNVHPQKAVTAGHLRPDLFFRLGVVMIGIPPLRDRRGDIPILVKYFIGKLNQRLGKKVRAISPTLVEAFEQYLWPGNVRELEHALEGAMNLVREEEILEPAHFTTSLIGDVLNGPGPDDPPSSAAFTSEAAGVVAEGEPEEVGRLIAALEAAGGKAAEAARVLGISPQLMNYKMKKYGLKKRIKVTVR